MTQDRPDPSPTSPRGQGLWALMTPARWVEVGRILVTGTVALLFQQGLVPVIWLWLAVAVGLYPLVRTGLQDLVRRRRIGTEVFVTVATLVAVFGGEAVAGAILMVIILIAEFIAALNTDRARASPATSSDRFRKPPCCGRPAETASSPSAN
ncbi:hypothetical protein [Brevundimonas sp.]|uniref:hypothetical protein n=1 Tax=Brevundimonas sp. TaxID=1871086 RepID=UPI0028B0A8A8|nr:hypothetical protein [Brevundimonas sp.]